MANQATPSEQEITEHIERGETLFLDGHWPTYITKDPNGGYIARSTAPDSEAERAKEAKGRPLYEEVHYDSVLEAVLAQLDVEWHDYTV